MNKTVILDEQLLDVYGLEKGLADNMEEITKLENLWKKQDYAAFQSELDVLNEGISATEEQLNELNMSLVIFSKPFNVLVDELSLVKERLEPLRMLAVLNQAEAFGINNTIKEFNFAVITTNKIKTIVKSTDTKHEIFEDILNIK